MNIAGRRASSWTNTNAYALTDSNIDNAGVVNQYLQMGRAKSVGQLLKVEEQGSGIPFFNTIAADRRASPCTRTWAGTRTSPRA